MLHLNTMMHSLLLRGYPLTVRLQDIYAQKAHVICTPTHSMLLFNRATNKYCQGIALCSHLWKYFHKCYLGQDKCYHFKGKGWILSDSTVPEGQKEEKDSWGLRLPCAFVLHTALFYEKQSITEITQWWRSKSSAFKYLVHSDSEITILTTVEILLFQSQSDMKNWAVFASATSLSFLRLQIWLTDRVQKSL